MRVGIVGTGWGRMHVGAFRAAGAEITALCGRDADKTAAIARSEGVPLATTDIDELCAHADVVVVASSDAAHVAHVRAALAAGRPVLCEKPLATTAADARALADAARDAGIPAAVCFPYRMLGAVRAVRGWTAGREPARGLEVVLRNGFLGGPDGSGDLGGASHVVDAALHLLGGAPRRVVGTVGAGPAAYLALEVDTGARASLAHRPGAPGGSGPDRSPHAG